MIYIVLYFLAFAAASFLMGGIFLKNKKIDSIMAEFSILVWLICLGRFLTSVADTIEVASFAIKILYLGSTLAPFVLILILEKFCAVKISFWIKLIIFLMAIFTDVCIFSIGYSDLYYKSFHIESQDHFNYVVKEYGPLHIVFPIYVLICSLFMVGYVIYGVRKKRTVSVRTIKALSFSGILVIAGYIYDLLSKSPFSYTSVFILICSFILNRLFSRYNAYDMTTNIQHIENRLSGYGYIVFDNQNRYVNANAYIKAVFPEINETWKVDEIVTNCSTELYDKVIDWALFDRHDHEKEFDYNGACYAITAKPISYRNRKNIGCLIEFLDRTEEHKIRSQIKDFNDKLQKEVAVKTRDILHTRDMMILGMASMVESRDNSTGGHIKRTSAVVQVFAKHLRFAKNYDNKFLKLVTKAAPMHDLGKIAVDDAVLRKNGKFTDEEYDKMKAHSAEGARIVKSILEGVEEEEFVNIATNVAHYHHEKWDGSGYPEKISGENIPLEARIMALADVFDALVSKRCYKEAFTYDKAFGIIEESLGSHFDPELGRIFIECREELEELYSSLPE